MIPFHNSRENQRAWWYTLQNTFHSQTTTSASFPPLDAYLHEILHILLCDFLTHGLFEFFDIHYSKITSCGFFQPSRNRILHSHHSQNATWFLNHVVSSSHLHVSNWVGDIKTHTDFLSAIGRKCQDVGPKFTSWEDLFKKSSSEMAEAGIPAQKRKYIVEWREWFK